MTPPSGRQLEITLLQERSTGTFAKVYLAEARGSDNLSRIVAVKVLKEQWAETGEVLDRTYDEARLLARLHHKNILRVEALTELEGQPAIVMEFVDGVDLKQLIERLAKKGERIPPRAAYKIAQDTAGALEAAYFKVPYGRSEPLQVVHRDVKPSNIMVSVEGEVKVLDFGTARSNYEGRLARTGALRFGSLKYMSPERREGDRGDHTTDVYALGLVLLEMLRGENLPLLPLDANEHDEALAEILSSLGPLGLPNEQWDDSLRQTLAAMCASQPSHRLNASQVVQLLRAFAEQASGASLDSFASDVVTPVTKEIYGVDHQGPLTGTRIMVSLGSPSDGAPDGRGRLSLTPDRAGIAAPKPTMSPEPATGAPRPGASMIPGAVRSPPPGNRVAPAPAPPPQAAEELFDDELMPTMLKAGADIEEMRAQAAAIAEPQRTPAAALEPRSEPRPEPRPAPEPVPVAVAGPADFAAQGEPMENVEQEGSSKRTVLIGVIAATVGLMLVLGIAGVGLGFYFFVLKDGGFTVPGPVDDVAVESSGEPPATDPVPAAGAVSIKVQAADGALLQWIKLTDAGGQQVLKGSPAGDASIPPGAYTLSAKMVGRPACNASVTLDADTTFTCRTDEESRIFCAPEGGTELALAP